MYTQRLFLLCCIYFLGSSASPLNGTQPRASCTVTSYSQINNAVASCTNIVIQGIDVPAGKTLYMNLKDHTTVTFQGYNKFDYHEWEGPLVWIRGNAITVQGSADHVLDGQGAKYWDGTGDNGRKKPKFFYIQSTGGSQFKNIHLLNCPRQCTAITDSDNIVLDYWKIDCSSGDKLGRNTDGFDIANSKNIVVQNAQVKNQDDCVAINQGSNMKFHNLWCYGGHGLSLAVGQDKSSSKGNIVSNIEFSDSHVVNSRNGIHIKTQPDAATGSIKGVTYRNIEMSGISYYAINVEEDYQGGGPTGHPKGNIPITGLTLSNIYGTMSGEHSVPVYILCGSGGCADWHWSGISIKGNRQPNSCNFRPNGFSC